MYLRTKTKAGKTYLYMTEDYYDPTTRKRFQKVVESLGRLDVLEELYPDPISHFKEVARQKTEEANATKSVSIDIDLNAELDSNEDNIRNVGYSVFRNLYKELNIPKFWNWKTTNRKVEYSAEDIFRLLVMSRILYPDSKRGTFEGRGRFFEPCGDFSLDDVYHCLDLIADNAEDLQKWIYKYSDSICKRDLSTSYFDCTNYYFDIGRPDVDLKNENGAIVDKDGNPATPSYRKRGPEKNHRPDPIIEMGLLMDKNGIPLAYNLFPGNESEKVNMLPLVNKVRNEYGDGRRVIIVADRGLNTSDNIYFLNGDNKSENNERDGYLYGQSVRGADQEFKDWVLSGGYKDIQIAKEDSSTSDMEDSSGNIIFRCKSRTAVKTIHVNCVDRKSGKAGKKAVKIDQKQLAYYSEKYAKKQRADRDAMVARAKDLIKYPQKYTRVTSAGSAAYIKNIKFSKDTGEVLDGELLLDTEKIAEEEKYDGYYSIVTSELNMSDVEIRNTYRGLAKIEDTFKVTKSELEARPIFLWTNKHIEAHFAVCFAAIVLVRLLEAKLGKKYSAAQIIESLRKYSCVCIHTNLHQFIYYDEIIDECGKLFSMNLKNKYQKTLDIRRMIHY